MADKVKIGLVGVHLAAFEAERYNPYKRSVQQLEELSEELNFDFHPIRRLVETPQEADAARRELDSQGVDLALIQTSSFPNGEVIVPLSEIRARLGLWAVPEPAEADTLDLNSFCGMNMFASILQRYLHHQHLRYKWFFGQVEDELFRERFVVTLAALRAIKGLTGAHIGFIGGIAPGFYDLYFDERMLHERLGVRVRRHEIDEVVQRMKAYTLDQVGTRVTEIRGHARRVEVTDAELGQVGRLSLALHDTAREYGYQALAVSCWPRFQDVAGLCPCASYADVGSLGVPVACEGDVVSAVSMLMLNLISGDDSMVMDLAQMDESDQTVYVWHCGPAPWSFANQDGTTLNYHSIQGREQKPQQTRFPAVADMVFQPTEVTIARVTGDAERLMLITGRITDKPSPLRVGARGWIGDMRLAGEPISVRDLVNTILVTGFEHHYPIARGNWTSAVQEVAAWTGLEPVERVPYSHSLQWLPKQSP